MCICVTFLLLFYLSEGLIFILPDNLVFARANVGVGGTTGKKTLLCLLACLKTVQSIAFKIQQKAKNGCMATTSRKQTDPAAFD